MALMLLDTRRPFRQAAAMTTPVEPQSVLRYCRRDFSAADLETIRRITDDPHQPTRAEIVRTVCAALHWTKPTASPRCATRRANRLSRAAADRDELAARLATPRSRFRSPVAGRRPLAPSWTAPARPNSSPSPSRPRRRRATTKKAPADRAPTRATGRRAPSRLIPAVTGTPPSGPGQAGRARGPDRIGGNTATPEALAVVVWTLLPGAPRDARALYQSALAAFGESAPWSTADARIRLRRILQDLADAGRTAVQTAERLEVGEPTERTEAEVALVRPDEDASRDAHLEALEALEALLRVLFPLAGGGRHVSLVRWSWRTGRHAGGRGCGGVDGAGHGGASPADGTAQGP